MLLEFFQFKTFSFNKFVTKIYKYYLKELF